MNTLTESHALIRLPSLLWSGLLAWLLLAILVAANMPGLQTEAVSLLLAGGVTLPVVSAYLLWRLNAGVRQWVVELPLQALVSLHAVRTVGLGFIFLSLHGLLHPMFAWPAAIGDALAAVGALVIAINLAQGRPVDRATVRRWNRFGMLDFGIAVAAGFSLRSTLFGDAALNTDLMGSMPLALFPLFAVPLLFITHLAIAAKLTDHGER